MISFNFMSRQIRIQEIKRKQRRQRKLRMLRARYQTAKNESEQKKILAKMKKIAPWLSEKDLLLGTKN